MTTRSRLGTKLSPLIFAAMLAACARIGGPAPVVGYGASGSSSRPASTQPPAPLVESTPGEIIVRHGDTLYSIARRNNVPMRAVIDANNLQPPFVLQTGRRLTIPSVRSYRVQTGDTLSSIARRYGVGTSELVRANALPPPYNLRQGQVLVLPPSAGAPPQMLAERPAAPPPSSGEPPGLPAPRIRGTSVVESTALPPLGAAPAALPAAAAPSPAGATVTAETAPPPVAATAHPPSAPALAPPPPPAEAQTASLAPPPAEPAPAPEPEITRPGRFLWPVHGTIVSDYGSKPGGLQNDGINIAAPRGTPIRAAESGVVVYAGNELRGFGNLLLLRHKDGWITAYAHADQLLVHRGEEVRRGQVIARVGSSGSVTTPQLHFEVRKGARPLNPMEYLGPQTAAAGSVTEAQR